MNSKIYNNSNKSIVTLIVLVLTTLTLSNCVLAKEKVTESLSETGSSKKYESFLMKISARCPYLRHKH